MVRSRRQGWPPVRDPWRAACDGSEAEGVGFEPTDRENPVNSFQGCRIQPLCHPSGRSLQSDGISLLEYACARWRRVAKLGGRPALPPAAIESPGTREELAEIVRRAADRGLRVRASGSGHSFTEIALTDGVMVRLDRLDRVLAVDRATGLVKVEAGIVLGELNRRLDGLGLAFENLGDIDRQTLAGSISTGTHGTGARFPSVSAQVEAVEMVLADGTTLEISAAGDPAGARGGADRPRRARADLRGHRPHRPRLHPRPPRQPEAARRDPGAARRAQRGQRPLRVLRVPPHRDRPVPREQAHRRAATAPVARRRSTRRR